MRIEGKHICNNQFDIDCQHEYEWMAIIPNRASDRTYDVETIDKTQGQIIQKTDGLYTVKTICPKCDQDNIIEHEE
ncbi:hypothetical protein HQN89_11015 [Paenibacillus frigoriresistens]|uniref:hypothetical protein n=1 Tax=Paenibacillus alginolyticus TaxID=59839 RepID=UPI00156594DC|nr:hypothetical protein [Paenibacillus frigoriresistens]NRF91550.1 hypothetical protein [Paenibacillus frigoriresistens]